MVIVNPNNNMRIDIVEMQLRGRLHEVVLFLRQV